MSWDKNAAPVREVHEVVVREDIGEGQCVVFDDDVFAKNRRDDGVAENFLQHFSLTKLANGGGKGGAKMAEVPGGYIVKELTHADHISLLEFAPHYVSHLATGETLLCPIYMHFEHLATKRMFFAMKCMFSFENCSHVYDLKACNDDKTLLRDGKPIKAVHKRIWNVGMWFGKVLWSDQRRKYYAGKIDARQTRISMQPDQRKKCLELINRDAEFLTSLSIMDYSLLVAIGTPNRDNSPTRVLKCYTESGEKLDLSISIIDFLTRWTLSKKTAMMLKVCERNKATIHPTLYGARFYRHFASGFVPTDPEPDKAVFSSLEDGRIVREAIRASV